MKKVKEKFPCGISFQGEIISMLRFADDIVLLAERAQDIEKLLNDMNKILKEDFELNINHSKTKVMK